METAKQQLKCLFLCVSLIVWEKQWLKNVAVMESEWSHSRMSPVHLWKNWEQKHLKSLCKLSLQVTKFQQNNVCCQLSWKFCFLAVISPVCTMKQLNYCFGKNEGKHSICCMEMKKGSFFLGNHVVQNKALIFCRLDFQIWNIFFRNRTVGKWEM